MAQANLFAPEPTDQERTMAMGRPRRQGFQEFTERFGQRVAELRKRKGWTQAKLAEALDVGDAYLAKLETGARRPSFRLVQELALVLGQPARELFNFGDDTNWQGVAWEENARHLRDLLAGKPADEVRLLTDIAKRIWHE
jgi:transcriptional regulator with XRE-family HTH domain